jgi:hypothetical protein
MSDTLLAVVLGFIAGAVWRAVFLRAWQFGWMLLGPYRATESAVAGNQMSARTAGRALLATIAAFAVSGVIILGLSLPARPVVEAWTRFRWVWVVAFAVGVFVSRIVGGRRAV